jgi:hypothetical protein
MNEIPPRLHEINALLKDGKQPQPEVVRTFLSWFGAQRRGEYVVRHIRKALKKVDIETQPDFASAYIDAPITFARQAPKNLAKQAGAAPCDVSRQSEAVVATISPEDELVVGGAPADARYRMSRLKAANTPPITVTPEGALSEAVTLMMSKSFWQLPVMIGERDVKGIISWESITSGV